MTPSPSRIGDVTVPPVAIGTMYFGTHVPTDRAHACLDAAYEHGARFWDTANNYAFWAGGVGDESESTIGSWLARRGSTVRDQVVLATKVGARPRTPDAGLDDVLGLSRAAVREQVHDSLRRLRTDHLDVLYAHVDDPAVPVEETLTAFGALLHEGTVRAIAASNLTHDRLAQALDSSVPHRYQALQQRFTYLSPRPGTDLGPHVLLDDATAALCQQRDVTRLGYAPLLSGSYTRDDRPYPEGYAPTRAALEPLRGVAATHDLDTGQAVLSWMVQRASPVIPVVGVSRPGQVTSAWRAVCTELTPTETERLDRARALTEDHPHDDG